MSRLFAITRGLDEIVASLAVDTMPAIEVPSETVEGASWLIVVEGRLAAVKVDRMGS